MTAPEPPKSQKRPDFSRAIGFLIGCFLFALFPNVLSSVTSQVRAHVTVTDIQEVNSGTGWAHVVTYSNQRKQAFSSENWSNMTVGDEVYIAFDPHPHNEFKTAVIAPGSPPEVSRYDTSVCIAARILIVIICITLIALFYKQIRLIAARKDTHDPKTV